MRTVLALCVLLVAGVAAAAPQPEDDDLDRIPKDLPDTTQSVPAPPPRHDLAFKLYVEDAAMLGDRRDVVVPFPSPAPYDRQNRTSVDLALQWRPASRLELVLSDRVDVIEQEAMELWSRQTIRNALREAYVSWEAIERGYLELGRINVREGAALGFNPTDFLRAHTLVGQASLDPSVLRLNRLGTLMVRAQIIGDGWSASALYAPRLADPSPIQSDALGVDPRFDATNGAHRGVGEVSTSVGDVSAQLLVHLESRRSQLGVNLTRPLGGSVIAYAEWAGGFDHSLIERAIEYGRETGTLPPTAPAPIATDTARSFRNDAAIGGSWTIATKLTVNAEYHLHQGGFSQSAWDHWFSTGMTMPALAGELWYVRGYANDQLEPVTRHQLFVRVDWPKAWDHVELSGFAFVSLYDGSVLSQLSAAYYASDAWTATFSLGANLGTSRSERGSFPTMASGIVEVVRYF